MLTHHTHRINTSRAQLLSSVHACPRSKSTYRSNRSSRQHCANLNNHAAPQRLTQCPKVSELRRCREILASKPFLRVIGHKLKPIQQTTESQGPMFEKSGKFYADWRDASGKRLRKSFTSRRAALQFEAEQKELAHPKQKARGQQSPHYSAPRSRGQMSKAHSSTPAKRSSAKLVVFHRKGSAPPTLQKSTRS